MAANIAGENDEDDDDGGGALPVGPGRSRGASVASTQRGGAVAASPQTRGAAAPPPKGRLNPKNVEAALREREEMRQEEQYQTAMSRSMTDRGRPNQLPPVNNKPTDARAAAAAAAAARANAVSGGTARRAPQSRAPRAQLAPLAPISPNAAITRNAGGKASGGGGRPLPPPVSALNPLHSETRQHTAAFRQAVDSAFNEWCSNQYAGNSFLYEIGDARREEQRDAVRDQLEREWRAAGRPVYEYAADRGFDGSGPGHRLGGAGGRGGAGGGSGRGRGPPPPRLPPRTYDLD